MLKHEAEQTIVAKLRGTVRQRSRKRRLSPVVKSRAGTKLVRTTSRETDLVAEDIGLLPGYSAAGPDEPSSLSTRLLIMAEANQALIPQRRGEGAEPTRYEILPPMGSPSTASEPDAPAASPYGVSAFIARVLDQLTLTAWLPAAFLTASVAILLQFRADKTANLLKAIQTLTVDPVRVLVLMIPALLIATVVTQAFSFEAIRTLEGYWRRRGLPSLTRTLMIRRHVRRKRTLARRRLKAAEKAFSTVEPKILRSGIPFPVVNAMKAQALQLEDPPLTDEARMQLEQLDWTNWCDAWRIAIIDHLDSEQDIYPPATQRILPTKLGNLIRATEDQLVNIEGDMEGFALRRYAMAPRLVQIEHDKFRDRLEMYCTLVFVGLSLVILTPVVLLGSKIDYAAIAIIAACFAALSQASYLAAIASAGGYCSALKEMDKDLPNP
jgi:hypothetical protein